MVMGVFFLRFFPVHVGVKGHNGLVISGDLISVFNLIWVKFRDCYG